MINSSPPTDQRAGVRPIAFVLNTMGAFSAPVVLKIRPEDLQRSEPSRTTVTQTLGRSTSGWVDNFGEGLPSATISGHTGWRSNGLSGLDGAQAFDQLNNLVAHQYHSAKQAAIDAGMDPASVKLLFVDMLDGFCWNVAPISFQLRRSRSRPLLFQYNINLQAVDTNVDSPLRVLPFLGDQIAGLGALGGVLGKLWSFAGSVKGWVEKALSFVDVTLKPIAGFIQKMVSVSASVMGAVISIVSSVKNGISGLANRAIGLLGGIAQTGVNVFRTITAISGLPAHLQEALSRVSSAYNETVCILKNSLRPRDTYEDYDGLYGSSNCSSTTGGRGPSQYANMNAFSMMQMEKNPIDISSAAAASVDAVNRGDPVLAPMPLQELGRHVEIISSGIKLAA